MKVLPNACVWGGARDHALQHNQVLITLDKDFGEIAVVQRHAHCGILRLVNLRAEAQGDASIAALARYAQELSQGGIVTIEPGRVRVRPPETDHQE